MAIVEAVPDLLTSLLRGGNARPGRRREGFLGLETSATVRGESLAAEICVRRATAGTARGVRRWRRRTTLKLKVQEVDSVGDDSSESAVAIDVASRQAWRCEAAQKVEVENDDRIGHATGVAVPEVGHADRAGTDYRGALGAYVSGGPDGLRLWLLHSADAVVRAAAEGTRIADAVLAGRLG